MNGIFRIIAGALLISSCHGVQAQSAQQLEELEQKWEGIWRDVGNANHYFLIHVKGPKVVLVDLAVVERTGVTLQGSYLGDFSEFSPGTFTASLTVLEKTPLVMDLARLAESGGQTLITWCRDGCQPGHPPDGITGITKLF
jgi:hypothetical protein